MPADSETYGDPRSRLVREKYFCLRPRPLERWLWQRRIPASAERVFWLHWQEGMQRGDWCSEMPLSAVARECQIDVSTVTRAYQLLSRLGCLRRTDQGRDPANPFQQATALTEIRIPRELLTELNRHPNRRATDSATQSRKQSRAPQPPSGKSPDALPVEPTITGESDGLRGCDAQPPGNATPSDSSSGPGLSTPSPASRARPSRPMPTSAAPNSPPTDPFNGLSGRARSQAISQLIDSLSPPERHAYQEALRLHQPQMAFEANSKLSAEDQARLCQILTLMSHPTPTAPSTDTAAGATGNRGGRSTPTKTPRPRKLTPFELGRLSRDLQSAASTATTPELMRQVVWSIETGALSRFDTRHALHIALKKIREGQWTRPHRMPPNWSRTLSNASAPGACGHA